MTSFDHFDSAPFFCTTSISTKVESRNTIPRSTIMTFVDDETDTHKIKEQSTNHYCGQVRYIGYPNKTDPVWSGLDNDMHGRKPRPHKVFPSSNNNYTRQNAELSIFVLFGSNHRRVCRCYVYIPIRSFSCINTDDVCSTTTTTKRTRRVSLYVTMPSRFILLKPIITRSITTICYFAVILLSIVYLVLYNRCSPVHWMAIFVRYNKLSKFVLRLFYSPHYWLILHYTTIMTSFSGCCCYCCCCRY